MTIGVFYMRYLTFALGKGRLANQTLELFEKIGITCEEMKDKNSRKLIFTNEELKLRFFLAKGPDVPTYVEYGAADIGVVGKDTILEEGRKVHEVLDLGYGKCKMCVCGYKDAVPLLQHHELIRVATKYPNIAKDYFYYKKPEHQAEYEEKETVARINRTDERKVLLRQMAGHKAYQVMFFVLIAVSFLFALLRVEWWVTGVLCLLWVLQYLLGIAFMRYYEKRL